MAQGVSIRYGTCHGGPWNGKQLAHHEDVEFVPIERFSKKIAVGVRPGTPGYDFGEYHFREGAWHWKSPPADSK